MSFSAYTARRKGNELHIFFRLNRWTKCKMVFAPSATSHNVSVTVSTHGSCPRNEASLSFIERSLVRQSLDAISGMSEATIPFRFEISMRYSNVCATQLLSRRS